jgi:ABC-type branched-subunit amino acid transport system substrate-binding protein
MNKRIITYSLIIIIILAGYISYNKYVDNQVNNNTPKNNVSNNITKHTIIKIGIICPNTTNLQGYQIIKEIAEKDINQHCLDLDSSYSFNFTVYDAKGEMVSAHNLVQNLIDKDERLVLGLTWNSFTCGSFSYIRDNQGLLISPGYFQEEMAPSVFSMYPTPQQFVIPIAHSINDMNMTHILVFETNEVFSNVKTETLYSILKGEATVHKSEFGRARSPTPEIGKDVEALSIELRRIKGETNNSIGVVYSGSIHCLKDVLVEVEQYEELLNVTWFSLAECYSYFDDFDYDRSLQYVENVEQSAAKIKLISAFPYPLPSEQFQEFKRKYADLGLDMPDFVEVNLYDTMWIMALSVLIADTTDASSVGDVVRDVSLSYSGVSGNCSFSEGGRRLNNDWTIWGFDVENNEVKGKNYGLYDSSLESIFWIMSP